jgi:hypothetical protein
MSLPTGCPQRFPGIAIGGSQGPSPKTFAQGPQCLSRYWRRGPAATSSRPTERPTACARSRRVRLHRCRGIHHHHTTVRGSIPVGVRPFHAHDRVADIRRLPLRDVWVCVHHRNGHVAYESGWKRHHLPEVLHEEPRRCQRVSDLRPPAPAPANGEPLAPLEFGIRHNESATIDGDDSIERVPMQALTGLMLVGFDRTTADRPTLRTPTARHQSSEAIRRIHTSDRTRSRCHRGR